VRTGATIAIGTVDRQLTTWNIVAAHTTQSGAIMLDAIIAGDAKTASTTMIDLAPGLPADRRRAATKYISFLESVETVAHADHGDCAKAVKDITALPRPAKPQEGQLGPIENNPTAVRRAVAIEQAIFEAMDGCSDDEHKAVYMFTHKP